MHRRGGTVLIQEQLSGSVDVEIITLALASIAAPPRL
jgi:starvation-inducible outer membrane lipoprotein